jgi:integrase
VSLYLQDCVNIKGELNSTSKTKEAYLSKFFKYLSNEGILKEKPKFNVLIRKSRDGEVYTTYNLDLIYKVTNEEKLKRKIKRKDILSQHDGNKDGNNRLRLIRIYEFLTLAEQVAPDIAFGLALEIFAGLRRGEVVNLLRKSLKPQNGCKYGENGLIIKVRSNREVLFNRLNNTKDDGVKKPRDQASLIDPILCYLYKKHLENVLPKYKKITNNKALFYDSNGNPMSAEVFDSRFKKVKERYIGQLLVTSGRKSDYDDFNETRWGSHIGRGIFTNMCRDVGYNVEQTSILRGDSTTEAMQSYFDIISATHNIERALELLSPIEYDGQIRNNIEFEELRREVLKKL